MTELILKKVSKKYPGNISVLEDISLEINKGEFIVFVGPSGCGKSTLLRMIAGLEKISSGELYIDDQLVNDIPPAERGIAMVFQSYALYPHMTVRENMSFALKIAKLSKEEINESIEHVAAKLKLSEYLDRLPKALSGGQRQRVAIGRAIVRNPKVYLFDEPLSNLDAALRVATRIEIAQLKEHMPDSTMVYVTHDQVEAMTLADRIVVLTDKKVAQFGSPLTLYEKPRNEFVAGFIGSPAMNFFPGKVIECGEQTRIQLDHGEGVVISNIPTRPDDLNLSVNVGIRPEHLMLKTKEEYTFSGTVEVAEALGDVTQLYLANPADPSKPVIAKMNGILRDIKGEKIFLGANATDVHLFHNSISLLYR